MGLGLPEGKAGQAAEITSFPPPPAGTKAPFEAPAHYQRRPRGLGLPRALSECSLAWKVPDVRRVAPSPANTWSPPTPPLRASKADPCFRIPPPSSDHPALAFPLPPPFPAENPLPCSQGLGCQRAQGMERRHVPFRSRRVSFLVLKQG